MIGQTNRQTNREYNFIYIMIIKIYTGMTKKKLSKNHLYNVI